MPFLPAFSYIFLSFTSAWPANQNRDTLGYTRIITKIDSFGFRECIPAQAEWKIKMEYFPKRSQHKTVYAEKSFSFQKFSYTDTSISLDCMPRYPSEVFSECGTSWSRPLIAEIISPNETIYSSLFRARLRSSIRAYQSGSIVAHLSGSITSPQGSIVAFDTTFSPPSETSIRTQLHEGALRLSCLPVNKTISSKSLRGSETLAVRMVEVHEIRKSYIRCPTDSAEIEVELRYEIPSKGVSRIHTFHFRRIRQVQDSIVSETVLRPQSPSDTSPIIRTNTVLPTKPYPYVGLPLDSGSWGSLRSLASASPTSGDSVGLWLMIYGNFPDSSGEFFWEQHLGAATDTSQTWSSSGARIKANIHFLKDAKRAQDPRRNWILGFVGLALGFLIAVRTYLKRHPSKLPETK